MICSTINLKENCKVINDAKSALDWMNKRWLEKGSSYNLIFSEVYDLFGTSENNKASFIENALDIYRSFKPSLKMSIRATIILDALITKYKLFLVTDGNPELQRRKFDSLGLRTWFRKENCIFTGDYGESASKPSINAMYKFFLKCRPSNCLFFGDRDIDEKFSQNAGMSFARLHNMIFVK